MRFISIILISFLAAVAPVGGRATPGDSAYVHFSPVPDGFPLVEQGAAAPLLVDAQDWPGVVRVARDFQADVARVSGAKPGLDHKLRRRPLVVIVGTLGRSAFVDALVRAGKIDVSRVQGRWESWVTQVVEHPFPGVRRALVIAGSDKRGTIYGTYELSEQIGVSPWYWWADVPVRRQAALYVRPGPHFQGPPAVKYRGIFLNDEEPALGGWAREKFGGFNAKMYARVFELILRLRGNYLWPAMWSSAFNEIDAENPRLADEYGIVMGTSHHEPMMRAHQEWTKRRGQIGNGQWNYATNGDGLREFFREGIQRNQAYENLVTIGMRGDGDEPMAKDGDMAANIALLERIVADQRQLLSALVNPDASRVPQLWALYKEVADYYEHGMKVPDDVTLLWCDDNWGNLRRLPTPAERTRSGGAGIYYHFDYVGSPRSYKWINTNPLPKIWEQMTRAHDYGADRVWIVNVGDLKPMELPIEFFLRLAWDPKAIPKERIGEFSRQWAAREFGPAQAEAIADIVSRYAKYNGWRKPELLEPGTFSLVHYREAERVLEKWQALTRQAEEINAQLPEESRDAFFQLVLYPVKASATVAELHIATGRNRLYAAQGRASAQEHAQRVRTLFAQDQALTDTYHRMGAGKWNHMMAQTRIGYITWSDPKTNLLPTLVEPKLTPTAALGVAVEGAELAWPVGTEVLKLPPFDSINQQDGWIDVFKRGAEGFAYTAVASQPWIRLSTATGRVDQDQRVWVGIDWDMIPVGEHEAVVTVAREGGEGVPVQISAVRSDRHTRQSLQAFGGLTGPTAILAESATRNIGVDGVRWQRIADYGRGPSGMGIFPTTAASVRLPQDSPRLEYAVFIPRTGEIRVDLITGPTLNVQPGRGLRIAVSFGDEQPQVVDAFAGQEFPDPAKRGDKSSPAIRDWGKWVRDNARTLSTTHRVSEAGVHVLKIWMVDPGVVLEKLVIHTGGLPKSYFGPRVAGEDEQAPILRGDAMAENETPVR